MGQYGSEKGGIASSVTNKDSESVIGIGLQHADIPGGQGLGPIDDDLGAERGIDRRQ